MSFVRLHVIVHSVLILLRFLTDRTDEESFGIFFVRVGHVFEVGVTTKIKFTWRSLPPPRTMRTMSSPAILLLLESNLLLTTKGIVIILRGWKPVTRHRINVLRTILLPTRPAPRPTTSLAHVEFIIVIQTTCEYIVTGGIFQSPSPTPRTLLCICRAGFRHLLGGRKG